MMQLLGPISQLAGTWLSGKVEEKAAQNKVKVAKAEAEAAKVSAATSEAEWDRIMANASANSWKDEWLTILFSIPLILCFLWRLGKGHSVGRLCRFGGYAELLSIYLGSNRISLFRCESGH